MRAATFLIPLFALLLTTSLTAQQPGPDARMKADVLLVVAHPDDDVVIGAILARLSLDEHKRVAVVYATDGDGGGNAIADESGRALGQIRKIEARRALRLSGIDTVWFLDGHDTPGQDPLRSLDSWNHGKMLNDLVRLVRITRPDVVISWLPAQVSGENHGDHQASAVLAVEAFDAAGDPDVFPEQLSMPRELNGMANLLEGLQPWQPQKLYFFTDAFEVFTPYWHDPASRSPFRPALDHATGPVYRADETSPSQHVSYAELEARQQAEYLTQEGSLGTDALRAHDYTHFAYPEPLIFGKSLVGGSVAGDIFENTRSNPIAFHSVQRHAAPSPAGITLEIGDPWHYYTAFWHVHELDHLATLLPVPELGAGSGEQLHIPLVTCNYTATKADISISPAFPAGWTSEPHTSHFAIAPNTCAIAFQNFVTPAERQSSWHELSWKASPASLPVGAATLRLFIGKSRGLPQ